MVLSGVCNLYRGGVKQCLLCITDVKWCLLHRYGVKGLVYLKDKTGLVPQPSHHNTDSEPVIFSTGEPCTNYHTTHGDVDKYYNYTLWGTCHSCV